MSRRKGILRCSLMTSALALLGGVAPTAQGGPQFSNWSVSSPTGLAGGCPIESRNGNLLFVAGGFDGTLDIFYYERQGRKGAFGERMKAGDPVSRPDADDFCPTPLPGQMLLLVSNRDGGCGGTDIYSSRLNLGMGEWSEPRNLGCAPNGPNTPGNELSPSLVETEAGTLLYFSTGPEAPSDPIYVTGQDIYESRMRMDGSFEPGMPVTELNTSDADRKVSS